MKKTRMKASPRKTKRGSETQLEETLKLHLFGLTMTPYALFIALGVLLGLIVFLIGGYKNRLSALSLCATAALALPLGLLGARAFYMLARWGLFAEVGFHQFFRADLPEDAEAWGGVRGGALWGAIGGGALAALIAGRLTRAKVSRLLDVLSPAAALAIALSRFGEFSIGEGIGPDVTVEGLCFFPMAVVNEWEEWRYAVFLLEGIVALIIFMVLVRPPREGWRDGDRARLFLILYSSCQIVLEALRRDNFLRWLFVRVSQVTAAVVLLGLFVAAVLRWKKRPASERMPKARLTLLAAIFVLLVAITVLLEFAADKSAALPLWAVYGMETLCAVGFGGITYQAVMKN